MAILTVKSENLTGVGMKGKSGKRELADEELTVGSDFKNLPQVEKFITQVCKKARLSEEQCDNMAIALTELVNNAIIHGNRQDPSKMVTLRVTYASDHVVISVADQGKGFDPKEIANPTDPQNLWKQNGRGIFLVRNLIDEVEICSSPEGTEIVLTEYLEHH